MAADSVPLLQQVWSRKSKKEYVEGLQNLLLAASLRSWGLSSWSKEGGPYHVLTTGTHPNSRLMFAKYPTSIWDCHPRTPVCLLSQSRICEVQNFNMTYGKTPSVLIKLCVTMENVHLEFSTLLSTFEIFAIYKWICMQFNRGSP